MKTKLGEEWGIWVSQSVDGLILHAPVESGFVSFWFDFPCSEFDLEVLENDYYRRKVLEFIIHQHLQPTTLPNSHKIDNEVIFTIIKTVLHGTSEEVLREIHRAPQPSSIEWRIANEVNSENQ